MTATASVTAPGDVERTPYLTQEALGAIRAGYEHLRPLWESGQLPPPDRPSSPLVGADAGAANGAALPPAPPSAAAPLSVRSGYRTVEEWQRVEEEVRAAARGGDDGPRSLSVREVGTHQRARALLTEAGFVLPNGRLLRISEAIHTNEFPYLLRAGFKTILFNSFAEEPTTFQLIADTASSNNSAETWLEMARLGRPGRVDEDEEYPEVGVTGLAPKVVRNHKRGYILKITEEMIRFDKTNQITQLATDRGAAMREEIDFTFYDVMTTGANFTRTSTDNNVGNNTGSAAFSPGALITAYETLATMKEARSGRYLGIRPNTLVCGTGVVFQAQQLLRSATIQSGEDAAGAAGGIGGVPDANPLRGLVPTIIASPQMGRYEWLLGVARRGVVQQEVEPLTLTDQNVSNATNEGWFTRDVWKYKARTWYGIGLYDDRYWYFSEATTGPVWT